MSVQRDGRITDPPETIAVLKEWAADTMILFHEAFQPFVEQLGTVEAT